MDRYSGGGNVGGTFQYYYGPYVRDRCGGKAILIWDNCSSHKVSCLQDIFKSFNIKVRNLPAVL